MGPSDYFKPSGVEIRSVCSLPISWFLMDKCHASVSRVVSVQSHSGAFPPNWWPHVTPWCAAWCQAPCCVNTWVWTTCTMVWQRHSTPPWHTASGCRLSAHTTCWSWARVSHTGSMHLEQVRVKHGLSSTLNSAVWWLVSLSRVYSFTCHLSKNKFLSVHLRIGNLVFC